MFFQDILFSKYTFLAKAKTRSFELQDLAMSSGIKMYQDPSAGHKSRRVYDGRTFSSHFLFGFARTNDVSIHLLTKAAVWRFLTSTLATLCTVIFFQGVSRDRSTHKCILIRVLYACLASQLCRAINSSLGKRSVARG